MEFSLRYKSHLRRSLGSQSGQGVIEYVLVLIVSVSIILGGIYQLNDAFRVWAKSYFGDYLACLLETGELPTIDGSPGDSGVCNQLFKPFSLADGRPYVGNGSGNNTNSSSNSAGAAAGSKENQHTGAGGASGQYTAVGGMNGFTPYNGSGGSGSSGLGKGKNNSVYTGSTEATNYGVGSSSSGGSGNDNLRYRLDTRFAFDDDSQKKPVRQTASVTKVPKPNAGRKGVTLINRKAMARQQQAPESSMTFGNFLRILIILAIILALVLFLGGQALNISKSME